MRSVSFGIGVLLLMAASFAFGWSSKIILSGVSASTLIQSATIVMTVVLAIWTYRATKRKEAEARLFTQKAAVYEPLVAELKRLHIAGKNGNPEVDNDELAKTLVDIQFKAIIWGDQDFLRALIEMGEGQPGESLDLTFGRVARLYEQMRKELGHSDKVGVGYDVIELLILASDRHLIRDMKSRTYNRRRTANPAKNMT